MIAMTWSRNCSREGGGGDEDDDIAASLACDDKVTSCGLRRKKEKRKRKNGRGVAITAASTKGFADGGAVARGSDRRGLAGADACEGICRGGWFQGCGDCGFDSFATGEIRFGASGGEAICGC